MATEKKVVPTNIKNVLAVKEESTDNTTTTEGKTTVDKTAGFDGTEYLQFQPIPFTAFGKIARINSGELSKYIRLAFSKTFHDLKGVNIVFMGGDRFGVEFWFQDNTAPVPEGKIKNLVPITVQPKDVRNNLYYMSRAIQNKKDGITYGLSYETRVLLGNFMFGGRDAMRPDNKKWETKKDTMAIVSEWHTSVPAGMMFAGNNIEQSFIKVTGLDLRTIVRALYGNTIITRTEHEPDGDKNYKSTARYEVRFIKANPDRTFIMNIEQFDEAAAKQYACMENPPQLNQYFNSIQMY